MSQDVRADEEGATQRRAGLLGLPYADTSKLVDKTLYREVLSVPTMYKLRVIPLRVTKGHMLFGITNTTSQQTIRQLRADFSDSRTDFLLISDSGFRDYMHLYDPPKKIVYENIDIKAGVDQDLVRSVSATLSQVRSDDELAYLVQQAYLLKASDIHLENQAEHVRVRFRVDGVLHPIATIERQRYHQLFSTIAVAANIST